MDAGSRGGGYVADGVDTWTGGVDPEGCGVGEDAVGGC